MNYKMQNIMLDDDLLSTKKSVSVESLSGQASDNSYIEKSVKIGKNVTLYPNVYLLGKTKIGDGSVVYPNTTIEDSVIGENVLIISSHIEGSEISSNVKIGPFAHIREGCKIGENSKIGNFVEVKNSTLRRGVKASHLAYIGDADIGENTNIGCGVIFANFNGKIKSRTIVGENCFIGSNSNIIAPVLVADNTYICAGTTLTKNTSTGDFVIARCREVVKHGRAYQYLKDTTTK